MDEERKWRECVDILLAIRFRLREREEGFLRGLQEKPAGYSLSTKQRAWLMRMLHAYRRAL